jgi:hypothetical protein
MGRRYNRRRRINVPALHPALAPLLVTGFRIAYVCTFMLEGEEWFFCSFVFGPGLLF